MIYFNNKKVFKTILPNTPLYERFDIIIEGQNVEIVFLDDFYALDKEEVKDCFNHMIYMIQRSILNDKKREKIKNYISTHLYDLIKRNIINNEPYYMGQTPIIRNILKKHMEGEDENSNIYRYGQGESTCDELGGFGQRPFKSLKFDNGSTIDDVFGKEMGWKSRNISRPSIRCQSDSSSRRRLHNSLSIKRRYSRFFSTPDRHKNDNNKSCYKPFNFIIRNGKLIFSLFTVIINVFILIWVLSLSFDDKKEDKQLNGISERLKKLEKVIQDYEDLQVPGGINE